MIDIAHYHELPIEQKRELVYRLILSSPAEKYPEICRLILRMLQTTASKLPTAPRPERPQES